MELYPHDGELLVYHPLNRTVIEIYMTYLHTCGECICIHCETMVLSRDVDTARSQVPYGMVSSMMTEFELVSFCSKSPGKKLMAQANPHHRQLANQTLYHLHGVTQMSGVSRPG